MWIPQILLVTYFFTYSATEPTHISRWRYQYEEPFSTHSVKVR